MSDLVFNVHLAEGMRFADSRTGDTYQVTSARMFSSAGKRTPPFVRFSTVGGEKGSADTERDPRGFAVKFYSEDGNWDMVGNNTPVFLSAIL